MTERRKGDRRGRGRRRRDRGKISGLFRLGSPRRGGVWQKVIVLLVIVVIAFFLMWFGTYLYNHQPEFYEPRDADRR